MNIIILLVPILVAVALLTLIERKIIGIRHFRTGPKKVGIKGLTQPFRDALKLFTKENIKIIKTNYTAFILTPIIILRIYRINWINLPIRRSKRRNKIIIIIILSILRISIFFFIIRGWRSNSKYRLIGAFRSTAQTISYEIVLILILLPIIIAIRRIDIDIYRCKWRLRIMMMIFIIPIWLTTILAETNRTPFDLTERERELVSGFNTEFSRGAFSVIFVAEYMSIIFIMTLTRLILIETTIETSLITIIILTWIIWRRITLPRIRYDKLIIIAWKIITPSTIIGLMMMIIINT